MIIAMWSLIKERNMRQTITILVLILMVCIMILVPRERPPDDVDCIITMQQGRMIILRGDDIDK